MQSVLIQKPYKFVPPITATWPLKLLTASGFHNRLLRKQHGVVNHECRNLDRLKASIDAGHGVMVTPNHARTADPIAMVHVMRETPCPFYTMASWHLFNQSWFTTTIVRSMGAFSVNREGLDKSAVDFAIKTLQNAERPLLIFPEGTTSRTNDQLMSLMDGPAFIARTAAKRRAKEGGKVVVHPVGMKYFYQGDLEKACDIVLTDIEKKLTWRPDSKANLIDRIVKVGNALLSLKEMQHNVELQPGLTLKQRQNNLVNALLHPLEEEWLGKQNTGGIALRIKALRMKIFPDLTKPGTLGNEERKRRWQQLEDTYLAQQVDCYPEQYLTEYASVDRILETVEKFEEDLTDNVRLHGQLKVVIDVDEPIEVSTKRDKSATSDPLMTEICSRLEAKLRQLQTESRMYS